MPRPDDLGWEQVDPEGVQRSPVLRPLQTDSSLVAEPEDETVPVCPVLTAVVTQPESLRFRTETRTGRDHRPRQHTPEKEVQNLVALDPFGEVLASCPAAG